MNRLKKIFKILIELTLIFLMFFIWLKFYLNSTLVASIISIVLSGILEGIIYIFKARKTSCLELKEKEKLDAEKMFLTLAKEADSLKFFYNLLSSRHDTLKEKEFLVFHENQEKIILFPFVSFKELTIDDICQINKKATALRGDKLIVICNSYSKEVINFLKNFDTKIEIYDKYQTYLSFYKEYEFYPQINKEIKPSRPSAKDIYFSFFSRNHAKGYIFSAIFLLIGSYFTRFNTYYLISTTILILFGLLCMFNKSKNPQQNI